MSTCLRARLRASAVEWPASITELAPARRRPQHSRASTSWRRSMRSTDGRAADGVARPGDHGVRDRQDPGRGLGSRAPRGAARAGARADDPAASPVRARMATPRRHAAPAVADLQRQGGRGRRGHHPRRRARHGAYDRPAEIAARLARGSPLLAICTYDSSPALAEAMGSVPGFSFDSRSQMRRTDAPG